MSRFIDVFITDETMPISREGFGLGFILDPVASAGDEYDYAEIRNLDDIPGEASPLASAMANQYLSQQPNPGVVTIQGVFPEDDGENATALINEGTENGEVLIMVSEAGEDGNDYSVEVVIAGEETPLNASFANEILTVELATDINGEPDDAANTATLVADEISTLTEFTADYSGDGSGVLNEEETQEFDGGVDPNPIGAALNQVVEDNNDWYGLLLASRDQTEIEQADDWIPANKLFITSPIEDDWAALQDYDLASDKTGAFPSVDEQEFDAAIMSRMFTTDPGSATWKWKQLSGVTSSGYLNAEVSNMLNAGENEPYMNPMIWEMGVHYTAEGKTVTGRYIDIQRAIDWLEARLTENIFSLLVNSDKVSYTDQGIARVVSRIEEIFRQAVGRNVIAVEDGEGLWEINAPRRRDIPTNDRANRILPDVNFTLTAAGAIHSVEVNGVVRV